MGQRDSILITLSKINDTSLEIINQIPDNEIFSLKNESDIFNFINSYAVFNKHTNRSFDEVKKAYNIAQLIKEECKKAKIEIITKFDDKYPERFKKLSNYPPFFYAKGNSSILKKTGIAIIGTRFPSNKGMAWGTKLSEIITGKGYTIISGLAAGSDSCAHIGCLRAGGETIAVMPTHLNNIYPSQNKKLFHDILDNNGCVISEYELGHPITENDFVLRDRLQAALAVGTIVIEAGIGGGTMHAVNTTLKLERPLAFLKFSEEHYEQYENTSANKSFLENGKALPIANSSDIDNFLNACTAKDVASLTNIPDNNSAIIEQSLF